MKKKMLFLSVFISIALALEGCATLRGIGEDIQSLGRALKRTASGGSGS
jgi:predicted small secreted protein